MVILRIYLVKLRMQRCVLSGSLYILSVKSVAQDRQVSVRWEPH